MDWVGWAALMWGRPARQRNNPGKHPWLVGGWNIWYMFFPYIGNRNPNWLYNIFQRRWNHQPADHQLALRQVLDFIGRQHTRIETLVYDVYDVADVDWWWNLLRQVPTRDLWVPPQPVPCSSWTAAECSTTLMMLPSKMSHFMYSSPLLILLTIQYSFQPLFISFFPMLLLIANEQNNSYFLSKYSMNMAYLNSPFIRHFEK